MRKTIKLIFISISILPLSCFANDLIEINILNAKLGTISDQIELTIRLNNVSDSTISFDNLDIKIPDQHSLPNRNNIISFLDIPELKPNESRDLNLPPQKLDFDLTNIKQLLDYVFYRSNEYTLNLEGNYFDDDGTNYPVYKNIKLQTNGSYISIILGGISGIILILIIGVLLDLSKDKKINLKKEFIKLCLGTIIIPIIIIVMRYTSVELPSLPLAINVKDYYGGLIIGLLYKPLVAWIEDIFITN